jgi:hypothetical protein
MDAELLAALDEVERRLVEATEPNMLDQLDEDGVLALHARLCRARNSSARASRTASGVTQAHFRAEGLEEALARASRRLADLATRQAEELRQQRLAAHPAPGGEPHGPGAVQTTRARSMLSGWADDRPHT